MPPTTRRSKQHQQSTLNFKSAPKVTKAGASSATHLSRKQSLLQDEKKPADDSGALAGTTKTKDTRVSEPEIIRTPTPPTASSSATTTTTTTTAAAVAETIKLDVSKVDTKEPEAEPTTSPTSKYDTEIETESDKLKDKRETETSNVEEEEKSQPDDQLEKVVQEDEERDEIVPEIDLSKPISNILPAALTALASEIPRSTITAYYNTSILATRKAKPIHQEDLSLNEKVLRHFDLSSQYGPCIGITRLNRWKRAHDMGLNPPIEVLTVCLEEEARGDHGDEPKRDTRNAYIDEFLSTKMAKD